MAFSVKGKGRYRGERLWLHKRRAKKSGADLFFFSRKRAGAVDKPRGRSVGYISKGRLAGWPFLRK